MTPARRDKKPYCPKCGLRVEDGDGETWFHLTTVAGLEAEADHTVAIPVVWK